MLSDILWPFAIVLIWALLFLITVLLVRLTMRGQQREVRLEREAELAAAQAAQASDATTGRARPATPTPQPIGPPVSAT